MPTALDHRRVQLGPGPFTDARLRNRNWLQNLDPDRLLHRFDVNAGAAPRAPIYGGWESATLSGHTLGHALSAWAREAADDPTCAEHARFTVERLDALQRLRGDGFVGAMPDADRVFGELRSGVVRSSGFDLNDCWVPWYNVHKTLAGLVDVARFTQNPLAEQVAVRLGDWIGDVTAGLDHATWQRMLDCEHGGMMEALADLAVLSGGDRFADLARRFHHDKVLDPLARGDDPLPGLHGNTQIPKVLGCARLFEVTGDERYRAISEHFLELVLTQHTYANGGHGSGEYFGKPGELGGCLSNTNCETCNTVNMLRLARTAFAWEPRSHLADFVERSLINHILASQRPTDGMVAYFTPLQSGRFRTWSTPEDSFWCCVGTGLESHTRYAEYVAWENSETLWLGGAVPGTVSVGDGTIALDVEWQDGRIANRVAKSGPANSTTEVRLRRPAWLRSESATAEFVRHRATGDFESIPIAEVAGDGFWVLPDAAQAVVNLPTVPRFEPLPDMPRRVAVCEGPFLLAVDQGPAPAESVEGADESPDAVIPPAPVVVSSDPDPRECTEGLAMVPFHTLWDRRSAVYLDCFSPEAWRTSENAYRASEARDHAERTRWLDAFWPFQMQPERDHGYVAESTDGGERSAWKFRQAAPGGWFSVQLRCDPHNDIELVATWGPPVGDNVITAKATVFVDNVPVGEVGIDPERHRHIEIVTAVPGTVTRGKSRVTVRIAASDNSASPPLFLLRSRKADHPLPPVAFPDIGGVDS